MILKDLFLIFSPRVVWSKEKSYISSLTYNIAFRAPPFIPCGQKNQLQSNIQLKLTSSSAA
jgi:hypothetical protein